jgi:hypothetical protein
MRLVDQAVLHDKAIVMDATLETLKQMADHESRFEPFYQPTMHAIFWLQEALKFLPKPASR